MTASLIRMWTVTAAFCVALVHADPVAAQSQRADFLPPVYSLPPTNIDRLFSDRSPWIQPVSCKSAASSPCAEGCGSTAEGCGSCAEGCGSCGEPGGCSASSGCCDDLMTRTSLTNGLWGAGAQLAECGILADLQSTHFYQGVTSGGNQQKARYGGKNDYIFTFVGEKLGLHKGFNIIMHAETRFGESLTTEAGGLTFPNTNMLFPLPTEHDTAITGLLLMQDLNERVSLAAGKINVLDFWTMVYPHVGRGVEGFMNLNSLAAGVPWLRFVNLSVNGGGILIKDETGKQIQGGVLVFDTINSTTTAAVNNMFDQGAGILGVWRFFHDWDGKPGSHLFAVGYSSRTYTSLDANDWTFIPGAGGGLVPGLETGPWSAAYYFDQIICANPCNAARNVRSFSGVSISDGNPSFGKWNVFTSLEAVGPIDGREHDRMGVSYFFNGLSSDFKNLVNVLPTVQLKDYQGVELYYNAEVTPWFHLTGDLQVVETQNAAANTAVIAGVRANIKF